MFCANCTIEGSRNRVRETPGGSGEYSRLSCHSSKPPDNPLTNFINIFTVYTLLAYANWEHRTGEWKADFKNPEKYFDSENLMTPKQRLEGLLKTEYGDLERWVKGSIPTHYKRINIPYEEQYRLAVDGVRRFGGEYGKVLYFTQAMISGAMTGDDYDVICVVTPWQYGKTWTTGHTALLMAADGHNVGVAANTNDMTDMIMNSVFAAIRESTDPLKSKLVGESRRRVDRIGTSLSRQKIAFMDGGSIEALTLGGTYNDLEHNRAVGKGLDMIIDEAALTSDSSYKETIRREFSRTDDKKNKLIAISNPHRPGWFYDLLTGESEPRTLIVWMDILTAIQEGRWTKELVMGSEAVKSNDTITKYLLCELPETGIGMFDLPKITDEEINGISYIGVDSAYRGKDNVCYARTIAHGGKLHVQDIATIKKKKWIQGKTSNDIIRQTARLARACGAPLTCVDVGQGIWLTEGLENAGVTVQGIHFSEGPTKRRVERKHYAAANALNKRAEMHLDLQQLIDQGQITFSTQAWTQVRDAWPFIVAEMKTNGKYKIREKSEIKQLIGRSPDELDAVLLSIHAAILDANRPSYITTRDI